MPLRYCAQNLLKVEPTPLYKFEWHLESKALMHAMCKTGGKIVGRFRIPLDGSPYGTLEAALEPNEHGRGGIDICSIGAKGTLEYTVSK
ncbi:hypothetical protein JHK82_016364 [Glycine max]|nr:hypothetical protein JHK87_016309 [Glycine soja]KAG5032794.1 hypothetical protein JHK85_016776 [Glycine max]KAG5047004.1 hypothetical protein JHK86_016410 [Glycine max]KAG5149483.1 hypothetical protein JHK82_016364 [Glycine max]